jgi:hypothetical protein
MSALGQKRTLIDGTEKSAIVASKVGEEFETKSRTSPGASHPAEKIVDSVSRLICVNMRPFELVHLEPK